MDDLRMSFNYGLGEVVSGLIQLRHTQLKIMYYRLGLEDPHMILHHMWKSLNLFVGVFMFVLMHVSLVPTHLG